MYLILMKFELLEIHQFYYISRLEYVTAFLLPEDGKPQFVRLHPLNHTKFLGERIGGHNYMNQNPLLPSDLPTMKDMLVFFYRDNGLNDNFSKPNQCIRTITGNQHTHNWHGPILVCKIPGYFIPI